MSRGVILQYINAVAVTSAEGTINFLYSPYLAHYGYTLPTIGSLSALFAILRLASRIPSGAAYNATTARRQLALWLVVFTLSTSGFVFAGGNIFAVIALTVVHGYAFGALGTINLAIVIDLTSGQRVAPVMGWYTAFISTGYAIGAFAGGWLADTFGIPVSIFVMGLVPVAAIFTATALPPFSAHPQAVARGKGLRGLFDAHVKLDARVWLAFVIALYINLLADSVDTFYPLFGLAIGIPLAASGFLRGLKSGSATFIRLISGAVFRYADHRAVNFWTVLAFALGTLVLPYLSSIAILVVVFAVLGIARGLLRVTSAAMVGELRDEGKDVGIASGVYNAGLDVGAILGPAVGGVLGDAFGLGAMFQIVAISSLVVYFAVGLASPSGRKALMLATSR